MRSINCIYTWKLETYLKASDVLYFKIVKCKSVEFSKSLLVFVTTLKDQIHLFSKSTSVVFRSEISLRR